MTGQRTQHTFLVNSVQTKGVERLSAYCLLYPGFGQHLRKSPLSPLSVLGFCSKSLNISIKSHSTHFINNMNKSVESVEKLNGLNTPSTGFSRLSTDWLRICFVGLKAILNNLKKQ